MIYKILLIKFLLITGTCKKSMTNDVRIDITNVRVENTELVVEVLVNNFTDFSIIFYKPKMEDICSSIIVMKLVDRNGQEFRYYPCESITDVDLIRLSSSNSIVLNSGASFQIDFSLPKIEINHLMRVEDLQEIKLNIRLNEYSFENSSEERFIKENIALEYTFKQMSR